MTSDGDERRPLRQLSKRWRARRSPAAPPADPGLTIVERTGSGSAAREAVGRFASIEGVVQVRKAGTLAWTPARRDQQLSPGDLVRTGPGSAAIRWADGTAFHVKEHSLVAVEGRPDAGKVKVISAPGPEPRND